MSGSRCGCFAPGIVKAMAVAAQKASVGPMAAVAGAIAEFVGKDLLKFSEQVIVENGGDIFIRTDRKRTLGIYAGEDSPFTGKLAIEVDPCESGMGICTSSGTVSHSLSFGNADKVKTGREAMIAAVIGIVIAFSAYAIINLILDALGVGEGFRAITGK